MTAAAQTPGDGAGVHALGGTDADAVAAAGLLGNLDNTKSAILAEVEAELDAPQTPDGQEEA